MGHSKQADGGDSKHDDQLPVHLQLICLQQQRYHREDALCSSTWQGLLSGRLWRTSGDFGRVSLHSDRGGFLGPRVCPGFCTRSLQQGDKPALLDQQQNQWRNLFQMIKFWMILLAKEL